MRRGKLPVRLPACARDADRCATYGQANLEAFSKLGKMPIRYLPLKKLWILAEYADELRKTKITAPVAVIFGIGRGEI